MAIFPALHDLATADFITDSYGLRDTTNSRTEMNGVINVLPYLRYKLFYLGEITLIRVVKLKKFVDFEFPSSFSNHFRDRSVGIVISAVHVLQRNCQSHL